MNDIVESMDKECLSKLYVEHKIGSKLLALYNGESESWRHKVFHNLAREESQIRAIHLNQYFDCGGLNEKQIEILSDLLKQDIQLPTCSIDYRFKVLLPECFIMVCMAKFGCDRELACKYLDEGGESNLEKIFRIKPKGKLIMLLVSL